jgi:nucleoporin NUP159
VCGPLAPLLESFEASSGDDGESTFTPKRILPLPPAAGPISFLAFASNNTKLLLALANGSILVYDAVTLLSEGSGDVPVLHTFPASAPGDIIGVFPNPGGSPELVGVLRRYAGLPGTQIAEVLDVNGMQLVGGWQSGDSPETVPTSSKRTLRLLKSSLTHTVYSVMVSEGQTNRIGPGKR